NYGNSSFPFAITSITDENGATFKSFSYDSYGRALTDQTGTGTNANLTTITYNDTAGTTTVQNALGQKVNYTFAALQGANVPVSMSRTATSTVPAATESFGYDSNGFLSTVTDWVGNVSNYTNDAHGD